MSEMTREEVLHGLHESQLYLSDLPEKFKKDREIILAAVIAYPQDFKFVDDSFKKDREFVLEAVTFKEGDAPYFVNERWIRLDAQILEYVDKSLWKDRVFVLRLAKLDEWIALKYLGECEDKSLWKDREFVLEVVQMSEFNWMIYDKVITPKDIDKSFWKDKEIVSWMVGSMVLTEIGEYIDRSLWKDREFVLEAVRSDGLALGWADDSLKKDREIVLTAEQTWELALEHADQSLWKDKEFIIAALKLHGGWELFHDYYNTDEIWEDRELVEIWKDREFVLSVMEIDVYARSFADESLWKDKKFVLKAIAISVDQEPDDIEENNLFHYVDASHWKDREFVLEAVKLYKRALQYADESLQKDPDILKAAGKNKP